MCEKSFKKILTLKKNPNDRLRISEEIENQSLKDIKLREKLIKPPTRNKSPSEMVTE